MGVDNSLRGARLALKPFKGVSLKLIAGQQRYYWHHRNMDSCSPWTYGGDLELSVDQWVRRMDESGTRLTLGLSAVSNHKGKAEKDIYSIRPTGETDPATGNEVNGTYKLNMPKDVAAFDVRANLQRATTISWPSTPGRVRTPQAATTIYISVAKRSCSQAPIQSAA